MFMKDSSTFTFGDRMWIDVTSKKVDVDGGGDIGEDTLALFWLAFKITTKITFFKNLFM